MEYFRFWNSKKALEGEEKEKKGKQKDKDYKGNSFSRKINSICKISWSIRSQMFFKVFSIFRNNHLKTPVLESENTWRRQKENPTEGDLAQVQNLSHMIQYSQGFSITKKSSKNVRFCFQSEKSKLCNSHAKLMV